MRKNVVRALDKNHSLGLYMFALAHLYDMVPSPELLLVLELLDPVALAGLAVAVWIRPGLVTIPILLFFFSQTRKSVKQ